MNAPDESLRLAHFLESDVKLLTIPFGNVHEEFPPFRIDDRVLLKILSSTAVALRDDEDSDGRRDDLCSYGLITSIATVGAVFEQNPDHVEIVDAGEISQ